MKKYLLHVPYLPTSILFAFIYLDICKRVTLKGRGHRDFLFWWGRVNNNGESALPEIVVPRPSASALLTGRRQKYTSLGHKLSPSSKINI
jgi:hypothetical protein